MFLICSCSTSKQHGRAAWRHPIDMQQRPGEWIDMQHGYTDMDMFHRYKHVASTWNAAWTWTCSREKDITWSRDYSWTGKLVQNYAVMSCGDYMKA
jgi:hypothetical protein